MTTLIAIATLTALAAIFIYSVWRDDVQRWWTARRHAHTIDSAFTEAARRERRLSREREREDREVF